MHTNLYNEFERPTLKSQKKKESFGLLLLQALIALPIIYFVAWVILGWN